MPNELESELIRLIDEMRRKYPNILDDILDKEHQEIKNNRREKIVITVLGSTKSSKSSLINFLLQNEICPTGNKEATARLTKITYGKQIRVTLISSLDKPTESFVFDDKEEFKRKLKELIVLKNEDRKTNLCEDEVIIEIPIKELENVELWDIPGFDENVVINNRITAILKDTDLILAVLAQQESLRKTAIDFIKPCLVQNDITTSENKNKPITKICFIITQIDKFKPDEQSNESKEDFLQHIYEKICKELPTNFPDANYKTSNQFIPMCSSYVHSVKDHLECRNQI
jgi:predicted GTPase